MYQNGGSAPITPIRSFLDRVRNRVRSNFAKRQRCVDGRCQPGSPSDPIYPPAVVAPPPEAQREYVTREDLEELKRLIESISLKPGPQGAPGRDGGQGPPGPAGKDGRDGKGASVDYDLLTREVVERLPPIYPMWIDKEGQVLDEIPGGVRLGDV